MGEREVPCEALTLEEACREKDLLISSLEREVAQQRQLRAQDARQVEAKALRIKDWVAHKLGELELQNAHLQEQNQKCQEQLELLKCRLVQLSQLSQGVPPEDDEAPPAYAAVDFAVPPALVPAPPGTPNLNRRVGVPGGTAPPGVRLERKRYRDDMASLVSSTASEDLSEMDCGRSSSSSPRSNARHGCAHDSKAGGSPDRRLDLGSCPKGRRAAVAAEEEHHDYAEIYTPSREMAEFALTPRPPTPPLHRFPSWESRIYEVAVNGITQSLNPLPSLTSSLNGLPVDSRMNSAFSELSVPVYAAVKGRASQIRSVPFTGDSSDSSDNEENTRATTTSGGDTESSLSAGSPPGGPAPPPPRRTTMHSPTKSVLRGQLSATVTCTVPCTCTV